MGKTPLIETVFGYEEFRQKLDPSRPIHHNTWCKLTPDRTHMIGTLRIYAWALADHLLVFEATFTAGPTQGERAVREYLEELVESYANPLGSTPGRLRSLQGEEI